MTQNPNTLPPLPSPCKGICALDDKKERCIGCLRTSKQIKDWPKLDNAGRLQILEELRSLRDQTGQGRKRKRRRA